MNIKIYIALALIALTAIRKILDKDPGRVSQAEELVDAMIDILKLYAGAEVVMSGGISTSEQEHTL